MSLLGTLLGSTLSLWRGTAVRNLGRRPTHRLHFYDMEGSAECKLVREVLTELDLDVVVYPCPIGGTRFRNQLLALGGRDSVPFLVDPNTSTSLYEPQEIIRHLFRYYSASASVPHRWRRRHLNQLTSRLSALSRFGAGTHVKPSRKPDLLLELYSFESSPYAKPVRELLCELELPYALHNMGKTQYTDYVLPTIRARWFPHYAPSGANRLRLYADTGKVMSPHLVDPNHQVRMYESTGILAYLRARYEI